MHSRWATAGGKKDGQAGRKSDRQADKQAGTDQEGKDTVLWETSQELKGQRISKANPKTSAGFDFS